MSFSFQRLTQSLIGVAFLAAGSIAAAQHAGPHDRPLNGLTEKEKAEGWILLFDGKSAEHWRGYQKDAFPTEGWSIADGALRLAAGGGGGDIVTKETFENFELILEWKATAGANSGIMYRVNEENQYPWQSGPEFQLLDDQGAGIEATDAHSAGALYDLYAPAAGKKLKPAGEWNEARIILNNGKLEHWVNGMRLVDADLNGPDWKTRVANSKFASYEDFGVVADGLICLQDHDNEIAFRNVRIRRIDASATDGVQGTALFNGRNLDGWMTVFSDGAEHPETFTVEGGIIVCTGNPGGYLRTEDSYENFILSLDWRWDPATKQAGNSGVLVRTIGPDKVWPKSIEAQLMHGNAGYLLGIDNYPMKGEPTRTNGRVIAFSENAENPPGEWNTYVITCAGDRITLEINGKLVNEAEVEENSGTICVQSEGTPIHFRNITIRELK
jgi:hypothetical protein